MFRVHLQINFQHMPLAYAPPPKQPFCRGSKWTSNMRPLPEGVPGLQEALVPGEKKFNQGYENKAPFGFSRSVDAMGFVAMDLGGQCGTVSAPITTISAPRWRTDSPGLPAVSRWRLGPQRRMGLCPTIPKGDFWVQTLQGAERSKVNRLDSGGKKEACVVGGFPQQLPSPAWSPPGGTGRLVDIPQLAQLPGRNF